MPELPEVETVKETLKKEVLNRTIKDVEIYYENIIAYPDINTFKKEIRNQKINNILRRGKFLMFELDKYYLLSHLRMEGRYYIRNGEKLKHEHVRFILNDKNLCYIDTRKFGRMYLIEKAIKLGGTTIRSYESSEGVHGRFQNELLVHGKDVCPNCNTKLTIEHINGRGTYYCKKCQK
mgnify:CR=1 FL=1